jgi:hypothetical protein
MAFNTILLKGDMGRRYEEARASVAVKPGHLIERDVADGNGRAQVRPHTVRGGRHERAVAIEDGLIGKTVNDTYAIGDLVRYMHMETQDLAQLWLKQGENVVLNDYLISNGDGTLAKGAASYLANITADSTTVTNTVAETTFSNGTAIVRKNTLAVGDQIRIRGQVAYPSTNATDTAQIKVYLGATVLLDTGALDVANNDITTFDITVEVRAIGAVGAIVDWGNYTHGTPATATQRAFVLASTAVDTTADQTIAAKITWSVANAANQAILRQLTVEHIKAGSTSTVAPGGGAIVGQADQALDLSAAGADAFIQVRMH